MPLHVITLFQCQLLPAPNLLKEKNLYFSITDETTSIEFKIMYDSTLA
jgi:hypothetical protein